MNQDEALQIILKAARLARDGQWEYDLWASIKEEVPQLDEAIRYTEENLAEDSRVESSLHKDYFAFGTAEWCEATMRLLTNGKRGCSNPEEHKEAHSDKEGPQG